MKSRPKEDAVAMPATRCRPGMAGERLGWAAFTLIELLTVISIIGVLAAIGVGTTQSALWKSRLSRVKGEHSALVTAIEVYHNDYNSYPPDNARNGVNVNPAYHQLYYELVGSVSSNRGEYYYPSDNSPRLRTSDIASQFNTQGFVNSVEAPETTRRNYLKNFSPQAIRQLTVSPSLRVQLLALPLDWKNQPTMPSPLAKTVSPSVDPKALTINPWRYVSTHPTNNQNSTFDLWAEFQKDKKINVIGNWK